MPDNEFFAPDEAMGWDPETGRPCRALFANSLQCWIAYQDGPVTLEEAAKGWRVPVAMIRQAVAWHPWMVLRGDVIELEGE